MRCPLQSGENPEVLLDYCTRKLDAATRAPLERHMEKCEDCRRFAAAQRQVWQALDAWEAAPVSEEFDTRLYARIAVQTRRSWSHRLFGDRFAWKPALPFAAACATAAIALMLNIPNGNPVAPSVQERSRVEVLEPEQVERAIEDVEMLRQLSTPGGAHTL